MKRIGDAVDRVEIGGDLGGIMDGAVVAEGGR
jgi:hypothetical protein